MDEEPKLPRPKGRGHWTSFLAVVSDEDHPARGLHEESNPLHRVRVEHDRATLLIHLSDEDGGGWTTFAVDRATRQWTVAQGPRQAGTAKQAYDALYEL